MPTQKAQQHSQVSLPMQQQFAMFNLFLEKLELFPTGVFGMGVYGYGEVIPYLLEPSRTRQKVSQRTDLGSVYNPPDPTAESK